MVCTMQIYADGGCRYNGTQFKLGHEDDSRNFCSLICGSWRSRQYSIPAILALQQALERYKVLDSDPYLDITISSDSWYAVNYMNELVCKWSKNGWVNAAGFQVVNRDLIQKASDWDDYWKKKGICALFGCHEETIKLRILYVTKFWTKWKVAVKDASRHTDWDNGSWNLRFVWG